MEGKLLIDYQKNSFKLLVLLISSDLVFITLHCLYRLHFISDPLFKITLDFGYGEVFQYIKEFWLFIILIIIAINKKSILYFSWSLLFIYLLLDDSLQIHEKLGTYFVEYFNFKPTFFLRAQDFGELFVTLCFAIVIFSFIFLSYLNSDNLGKRFSRHLFSLVLIMVFFGVVVDMLHSGLPFGKVGKHIFGLIEDGGEMLIMSILVWYAFELDFLSN